MSAFPIEVAELRASPKQRAFQRAFFDRHDGTSRKCDVYVALGGNRSGKSYVCGRLCFAKFLRDAARDGDLFWCIGQNLERSVGGQQRELWESLPRSMFGEQTWDKKIGFGAHRKVIFPTADGGTCLVEFRSADQDASTFEQAKLTGVWCDERLPEQIYDRLLARIVDRNGFILYSDIPEQWWQHARLKEAEPEAGVFFQHFTMHDNAENLPPEAITRTSAKMTADERRQRIAGDFVVLEGVIYREYVDACSPGFTRVGHLVKPFAIPPQWPRFRMIDYGASAPTACLWCAISDSEVIYCYREHYERNRSIAENARMILIASGNEQYRKNLIDPCAYNNQPGMTQTIAKQYELAGITPMSGWPRVNEMGEHSLVQRVKYRLENFTVLVLESCINLRRELRSWKYKTDREGRPRAADAFDDTGPCHLLDCLKGLCATNPTFATPRVQFMDNATGRVVSRSELQQERQRVRFI